MIKDSADRGGVCDGWPNQAGQLQELADSPYFVEKELHGRGVTVYEGGEVVSEHIHEHTNEQPQRRVRRVLLLRPGSAIRTCRGQEVHCVVDFERRPHQRN